MEIGFHGEFFKLSGFTGCIVTFIVLYFPVTTIAVVLGEGNQSPLLSTFHCGRFEAVGPAWLVLKLYL